MRKKISFFISLLAISGVGVFYLISENLCTEKRYTFDFGSAAVKFMSAEVNTCKKRIIAEYEVGMDNYRIIDCLKSNKAADNRMPKACVKNLEDAVHRIEKELHIDCKKDRCAGVATAWARKISDIETIEKTFEDLNINVDIISQKAEGELGFLTAISTPEAAKLNKENLVVWDIGGGSFQLSTLDDEGNIHVYNGPYGIESYEHMLRDKFKITKSTEFPYFEGIDLQKAVDMAVQDLGRPILNDPILEKKLQNPKIIILGISKAMTHGLEKNMKTSSKPTSAEILNLTKQLEGKSLVDVREDLFPDIPEALLATSQSTAIVIHGIMKGAGIEKVDIIDAPLNKYILTYPEFWN